MRRFVQGCFLVCLALALAGCWSQRDIVQQAFVMGLGFDAAPEGAAPGVTDMLTVQIAVISAYGKEGGRGTEPVHVTSATGIGASDANQNLSKQVTRSLYYGHTQSVIFGREMAGRGLDEAFDILERAPAFRRSMSAFVAGGKALDILRVQPGLEPIGALTLPRMAADETISSFDVPIGEFISLVESNHSEGALPIVSTIPVEGAGIEPPKGGGKPGSTKTAGQDGKQGGQTEEPKKRLRVEGIALFRGPRMVGTLKGEEAEGFLIATNRFRDHRLSLRTDRFGLLQAVVRRSKARISIAGPADRPKLKVDVTIRAVFWEVSRSRNFLSRDIRKEAAEELAAAVKRRIAKAIVAAQKCRSDAFGFGGTIYRKDPEKWRKLHRRWGDIFAEADTEVRVKARLLGTGSILRPAKKP